ncbi:hypothetical protein COCSUDRAFT_57189 [Coccomyxa subellipsoidea C-169]|uniref:Large ribosomal subunit protein mL59 domain-containing protein n=1 Tax=Coccomyxa subellipsoidea (strain C-169) TaxID=574566 RepID=I0YSB7_COCSC|nr:hypothetical protein COCSUDRAFT_57189 [Coccomyxa subellipsoidea C-169]EIE21286.1 hypothetical protein COCSUDRAFT_57189 [Coccomyxa subellipsoidea C-169]|eukprot:XP_005645830.1 hypothetical protein COCSUDRAFT_57189 [Coccomyxa subellipsoidea C-169]
MASALKKFGEAALKPRLVNGLWHKPKVSARQAADLKKAALFEGREWPYPEEEKKPNRRGFGQYKALKGHKHEKESAIREAKIAENLADMPKKIAAYRESRKLKEGSLMDRLLSTVKERRMKQYRTPNQK